jgi:hypothetical protein
MSQHKPQTTDDMTQHIVTSDGVAKRSRRKRIHMRRFSMKWIILVVALLVVGAGAWYALSHRDDSILPPKIVDISNVSDYSEMTKDQADYYLYTKTGLTIKYLQDRGVNSSRLKTFDTAYQAAQALFVSGDKTRALQAYAVAQSRKPVNDDYSFYMTYAAAALRSDDKTTWKKEMLMARAVLARQPQSTRPTEAMTVSQLDNIIKATEAN